VNETASDRAARKARLRGDFEAFCRYYFERQCSAPFGYFHKEAASAILEDGNIFAVLEWPREHAKSVFADIMLPLYLYANDELSGLIIVSANEEKAVGLLSDIQAQFTSNQRWVSDYGDLKNEGDWKAGNFSTKDGVGFWAFGNGQSPRGVRKSEKRPNLIIVDDIDTAERCRNIARVRESVNWILEDLYPCMGLKQGRLIISGNRIHSASILAHMVGDVKHDDPKRDGVWHSKVFALENPETREMDENGTPAWSERYTRTEVMNRMRKMGYRASRREYFHQHIEDGIVFSNDWVEFEPSPSDFSEIVVYGDPSFKNTKASDYKAIVAVGRARDGGKLHVLNAWVRQATIASMVATFYDWYEKYESNAAYYIEANMLQDLLFDDEFVRQGEMRGSQIPIRQDKRKKQDKFTRIENMTPLFERGQIIFNEAERSGHDMQVLIQQLLAFPTGHDDGPDALEGAVTLLQTYHRAANFAPRVGQFRNDSNRR
jgi:predicted phage terminase large subunit-like protein